jgi:chromosome segregation ATPase
MREVLISYAPTGISIVGALFSAVGAFWKDNSGIQDGELGAQRPSRRPSRLVFAGALIVVVGTLLSGISQHSASLRQQELQSKVITKTEEVAGLAQELARKSDKVASVTEQIASKGDKTAAVTLKLSKKSEEIASLTNRLAEKNDQLASLSKQLAAKSEENSLIRKQDLEARQITQESILRLVAKGCISDPTLQQQVEGTHNKFQRDAFENLHMSDSVTVTVTPKDTSHVSSEPKKP